MKGVYLLHYDSAFGHARHYLGASKDVEARIKAHRAGNGGKLPAAFAKAGIGFQIARVWETSSTEAAFELENKLKGRSVHNGKRSGGKRNVKLCPVCQSGKVGKARCAAQIQISPSST